MGMELDGFVKLQQMLMPCEDGTQLDPKLLYGHMSKISAICEISMLRA